MVNQKSDVLIIGGGVIGSACAYEISKSGAGVTLIDQAQPGMGCSYGNAGWITPCFGLPLPMPGMLGRSVRWLTDPISPLYIKPEPSLLLVRWLTRFLRSMNGEAARRSTAALMGISKYSLDEYRRLSLESGNSFSFEQKGLLIVNQTQKGFADAVHEMSLAAENGIRGKKLSEAEVRALEPALVGPVVGGVYFPDEAHCEPLFTVKAFLESAVKNGAKIISSAEVFEFVAESGKVKRVRTTQGLFEANYFVLATGSWTNAMTGKLKMNIPILGGKGYAMILKELNPAPKIPIYFLEKKVAITPRKQTTRIAGTLELVNQDFSISPRRVEAIIQGAQQILNVPRNPEILEIWRGLRPCTPDGVPIISFSKEYSNLLITAGHQMLGLQSAPGTARLAADLLLGKKPIFDPKPFAASRF